LAIFSINFFYISSIYSLVTVFTGGGAIILPSRIGYSYTGAAGILAASLGGGGATGSFEGTGGK
jgi:hypothetical protein